MAIASSVSELILPNIALVLTNSVDRPVYYLDFILKRCNFQPEYQTFALLTIWENISRRHAAIVKLKSHDWDGQFRLKRFRLILILL